MAGSRCESYFQRQGESIGVRRPRKERWDPTMRRAVFLCGATSFLMAFLGGILAFSLVLPSMAEAQQTAPGTTALNFSDGNGANRIRLAQNPNGSAQITLLGPDGTSPRAQLNTGGGPGNPIPDQVGFTLLAADGTTRMVTLGSNLAGPGGPSPTNNVNAPGEVFLLHDAQGQARIRIQVAPDGTPSMAMLDANGNVTWSAQ